MDRQGNQEPGRPQGRRMLAMAVAVLICCAAMAPASFGLDLGVDRAGGHAVLKLGRATVKLAFAFGQQCPESNRCASPRT